MCYSGDILPYTARKLTHRINKMKFKLKFTKDEHPVSLKGIQKDNMAEADVADVSAIVGVEDTVKKKVSQLAIEKIRQAEIAVIEIQIIYDQT